GARLLALWRTEAPRVERVDIRVRSIERPAESTTASCEIHELRRPAAARPEPAPASTGENGLESAPLDPRYRFESFAVGSSNKIAHETALAVASAAADSPVMFNPLFIHGGVGRGKTHLLQAIAWRVGAERPERRCLYLSAEQFVYRFVSALRSDTAI